MCSVKWLLKVDNKNVSLYSYNNKYLKRVMKSCTHIKIMINLKKLIQTKRDYTSFL